MPKPKDPQADIARQCTQVTVSASEIFLLWVPSDARALQRGLRRSHRGYRIGAVLPSQSVTARSATAFEEAGVLVVEVPAAMALSTKAAVARHLTRELAMGTAATGRRMDSLVGADEAACETSSACGFFKAINDPFSQSGGPS